MNNELIENYKKFLDSGKTERECVKLMIQEAESKGYKDISQYKSLKAGDKVYITKMNKAVGFFEIGSNSIENGMNILGAHIDSPRLDAKQNPLYEKEGITYLNTHYYGGIKKYQWTTIPLAIHGIVCKKDGTNVNIVIGEAEDDPVFCISDILPHLAQEQMKSTASEFIKGEALDLIMGSISSSEEKEDNENEKKESKEKSKKIILDLLKEKYGIEEKDFESAELEIVPAGKARDLGLDRSLILGYGHDDRSCAYASFEAMLEQKAGKKTNCCLCVDKEEIGSVGATGMASMLFENMAAEIVALCLEGESKPYSELTLRRCLSNSAMLSSDVNSAYDPMNANLYDKQNSSALGGGIAFQKYTGSRGKSGASDANPEFIAKIRKAMDEAKVKYQMAELGKVDQGGGGTIAYHAAKYGMSVLDAGIAVLSMHAPWEIISKEDLSQLYEGYKAFLKIEQEIKPSE